jgi:hypothetical protein
MIPESFLSMNVGPELLDMVLDAMCDASSSVSAISIPPALRLVSYSNLWSGAPQKIHTCRPSCWKRMPLIQSRRCNVGLQLDWSP